jgi:ABC-type antimicrobial peptide transport system permease subunit
VLFDVSPVDPLTYAAVLVVYSAAALAAAIVPARRALRVDPLIALRAE